MGGGGQADSSLSAARGRVLQRAYFSIRDGKAGAGVALAMRRVAAAWDEECQNGPIDPAGVALSRRAAFEALFDHGAAPTDVALHAVLQKRREKGATANAIAPPLWTTPGAQDLSPTLSVHAPSSMSALLALLLAHPKPKPTAVRPSAVLANATTAPPRPAVAAPAPGFRVIRPQPGAPSSDEMQLDDQPAAQQPGDSFITARAQLTIDRVKLNGGGNNSHSNMNGSSYSRKTLGAKGPPPSSSSSSSSLSNGQSGGGLTKKFVSPLLKKDGNESDSDSVRRDVGCYSMNGKKPSATPSGTKKPEITDERLKNIEPQMVEMIMNEMLDRSPQVEWEDIAGLEHAKKSIKEIVVWPMLRPDIFTGLRGPPKGVLLFGPPGTGKTMIGKCIASQAKATFFSISASSLTSKWVGEGEKMVRALFAVARCHQPAVIFMDEIDSLLSQRTEGEMESNRRIKTEFLIQLDGAATSSDDRILIIGATNRPQEIDEAARRRLVKRFYIPLPEPHARQAIVARLLSAQRHVLTSADIEGVSGRTEGYSGSDMANLCKEAAMGPIRTLAGEDIIAIAADDVRPISREDFDYALTQVRASVSSKAMDEYLAWNRDFGSLG